MSSLFHVSERSHAGLILMAELALQAEGTERRLTLVNVAREKQLSHRYLEEIASALKQANLITGKKGPAGGYVLTRRPEEITAEAILTALEGPITLVDCQQAPGTCPAEGGCSSRSFWGILQDRIIETVRTTTLAEIVHHAKRPPYATSHLS